MTNLPDAVAALLLDYELTPEERASINEFELLDLEFPNGPCPVWAEHGAVLVAHFVKRNPGRRPARWWRYDAPRESQGTRPGWFDDGKLEQPRERLGGTGTVAWEVLNVGVAYCCGVPSAWVTEDDREWLAAAGVPAVPIDPDDPPVYESQASYLQRHGLLSAHERRRLPEDAFEPEAVQARSDGGEDAA